jgi:hypothetical protein
MVEQACVQSDFYIPVVSGPMATGIKDWMHTLILAPALGRESVLTLSSATSESIKIRNVAAEEEESNRRPSVQLK